MYYVKADILMGFNVALSSLPDFKQIFTKPFVCDSNSNTDAFSQLERQRANVETISVK